MYLDSDARRDRMPVQTPGFADPLVLELWNGFASEHESFDPAIDLFDVSPVVFLLKFGGHQAGAENGTVVPNLVHVPNTEMLDSNAEITVKKHSSANVPTDMQSHFPTGTR